jgi:hypothetical protein
MWILGTSLWLQRTEVARGGVAVLGFTQMSRSFDGGELCDWGSLQKLRLVFGSMPIFGRTFHKMEGQYHFPGYHFETTPFLATRGGGSYPPTHNEAKGRNIFKAIMLELGGRSVMGDQSKSKENKLFGHSVLYMVRLRNVLVPDPEPFPEIMKKHFTEQMSDFVACPLSKGQGCDVDG